MHMSTWRTCRRSATGYGPTPSIEWGCSFRCLNALGVNLKIITGDNRLVAQHIAQRLGLDVTRVVTGAEIATLSSEALLAVVNQASRFAGVDPNQKEQIIAASKKDFVARKLTVVIHPKNQDTMDFSAVYSWCGRQDTKATGHGTVHSRSL
jgi:hypothetical protein